jgi:hypothetical protein
MKSHPVFMPDNEPAVSTATFTQRFSKIVYLTATTVAMVGWVYVFGRAAIAVTKWLLA